MNIKEKSKLLKNQINDIEGLWGKRHSGEFIKWKRLTTSIVNKIFGDNSSQSKSFSDVMFTLSIFGSNTSEESFVRAYNRGLKKSKALLEAFVEELNLLSHDHRVVSILDEENGINDKVFIIHGRDDLAKTEVARFLEQLGLDPVILHEQANSGDTIVEKLEKNTNVGFAVVLYTPCDLGGLNDDSNKLMKRARQNVVFEHGYLMGKIGRKNISALVKGEIETPNDISGIVYTSMEGENWKIKLAKDLKSAGYEIDFNRLF